MRGEVRATHTNPSDEMEYASSEALHQIFADWLPFFRRCCWLSGYPLEVSAHEKIEWMQEFIHEELQSWNLKM
ncbi:hypothetical protein IAD21_04378 [Abditibacteriota bacterium]|nr:hypothetical protein IAD21_04378 [Abditibacteriota bacterium]